MLTWNDEGNAYGTVIARNVSVDARAGTRRWSVRGDRECQSKVTERPRAIDGRDSMGLEPEAGLPATQE